MEAMKPVVDNVFIEACLKRCQGGLTLTIQHGGFVAFRDGLFVADGWYIGEDQARILIEQYYEANPSALEDDYFYILEGAV